MGLKAIAIQGSPHRGGRGSTKGKAHKAPSYQGAPVVCASCGRRDISLAHPPRKGTIESTPPKEWKRLGVCRAVCDGCSPACW